ncbi:pyridoxal phosphate-dependent aminotransferase, partial [Streptomyces sp. SID6041]|nr:pyridoxal phosphate-dependent aminotransferase [Streptomyces sp. SID6041]
GRLAAAAHRAVLDAGALARPPQAGRHLYADLGPLRAGLAARGVTDSLELESHLGAHLGAPATGGHRFGDELGALRVRFGTGMFLGDTAEERAETLATSSPETLPHVARKLSEFGRFLEELR